GHAADAERRGPGLLLRRAAPGDARPRRHPVLPAARAQRHLLGLPGRPDRSDARDRQRSLSGRAHPPGLRHPGNLPRLPPPPPPTTAHAPPERDLSGPGRVPPRPRVSLAGTLALAR